MYIQDFYFFKEALQYVKALFGEMQNAERKKESKRVVKEKKKRGNLPFS